MLKKLLTLLLSLIFTISLAGITSAKPNFDPNNDKAVKERIKKIEDQMVKEFGKGGDKAADDYLASEGIFKFDTGKATIESLGSDGDISISSSGNSIYDPTIECYFDSIAKKYIIKGTWRWNTTYYDSDNRPDDATGVFMTAPAGSVIVGDGCAIYDTSGNYVSGNCWTEDMDPAGIAHRYRDLLISSNNYLGHSGMA